jgi:cell division protein ZapE
MRRGWFSKAETPKGVYLCGDVGRGKSMLMDLFFESVDVTPKRRVHFNAFMTETHERIHQWRRLSPRERVVRPEFVAGAGDDPIAPVAKTVAREARLLCFDEFQVTDVADAMILGRLFERLFSFGVVMVLTSNTAPDRLYEGGLNRQLFLPFIGLIKQRLDVVTLNGPKDYRLESLSRVPVYLTPLGPGADAAMDAAWRRVTGTAQGERATLSVQGRELVVPKAAKGAARFTFEELCARPLGAADYLALARTYHTLFLDRIPLLTPAMSNDARRFTLLIDTLYDEQVKLVCSAAGNPDELYATGENADAFRRAASRLMEMQSADYLALPHGVHELTQMRHDD